MKEKEKQVRDYMSQETRIGHILDMIEDYEEQFPGTLLTHTFIQEQMEMRHGVSGTLIRKYIRHAIMRGLLVELRPSYDGSIGGIQIVTGNPVYIACVKPDVRYRLAGERDEETQLRQLALLGTPQRAENVLRQFIPLGLLPDPDCD